MKENQDLEVADGNDVNNTEQESAETKTSKSVATDEQKFTTPMAVVVAGIIIAGILSAFTLRKQFFPDLQFDTVSITMAYPGASPQDVESAIAKRIENVLVEIDEIDQIKQYSIRIVEAMSNKFKRKEWSEVIRPLMNDNNL